MEQQMGNPVHAAAEGSGCTCDHAQGDVMHGQQASAPQGNAPTRQPAVSAWQSQAGIAQQGGPFSQGAENPSRTVSGHGAPEYSAPPCEVYGQQASALHGNAPTHQPAVSAWQGQAGMTQQGSPFSQGPGNPTRTISGHGSYEYAAPPWQGAAASMGAQQQTFGASPMGAGVHYAGQPSAGMGAANFSHQDQPFSAGPAHALPYSDQGHSCGHGHPKHDQHQYGQLMGLVNDFANGNADPSRVMAFLGGLDNQFWKGALLGVAATLVLTNDTVKNAIVGAMSGLWGVFQTGPEKVEPSSK